MNKVIIMTPHPDDETLGCGGTLLRHLQQNDKVYWVIVTEMKDSFSQEKRSKRNTEIECVADQYQFEKIFNLGFEAAALDRVPDSDLIMKISKVFQEIQPNIVYVPYPNDIHSDHKAVFDASVACTKWFRYPSIDKVLVYETLSETDFTINPDGNGFRPNIFVNIEPYIDQKIDIMKIYESEISEFPFPRSEKAIRSLAYIRGAASGFEAAEAFMLLKERVL
ncbi:MAG: PIG-L family deacetylase [Candidatus Pristimantibacillus lignocellulolyticus]|uniref:PIG-L family deacetylase n=1 Tax=Candidatus Pristimantibacillus lignocellulolyticus TaxID=2994561 RepID=A0A9J6ZIU0_9BACL|nr:MAG: PIG-L family deacetylase [Candidatus Pristimantibacillus lignocellulolyticus]